MESQKAISKENQYPAEDNVKMFQFKIIINCSSELLTKVDQFQL